MRSPNLWGPATTGHGHIPARHLPALGPWARRKPPSRRESASPTGAPSWQAPSRPASIPIPCRPAVKPSPSNGFDVMLQSHVGGSKAVSIVRISTWPCSSTAHACPWSLLLAHADQQCGYHEAARCCTCADRHLQVYCKHKGVCLAPGSAMNSLQGFEQLVCKRSCLGDNCLQCYQGVS